MKVVFLTSFFFSGEECKENLVFIVQVSQLIDFFTQEISTQSIMDQISQISQYHRIQGSMKFHESAKYIQSILSDKEISSKIYEYPADGKWEKWGWVSPLTWDIKSGECWITEPVKKRLCRFIDHPMSVITHSKPANFEGTLVDVGEGTKSADYEIAKNKIALITASPRRIFSYAAKHQVKGLMLHPNLNRAAQIGNSTVQYDGFWPVAENFAEVTSGFSISHAQARELQQYLKNGKEVKLHFKIDASFSVDTGKLHVLEATIQGKEKPLEEVVLIAHLCHPSPGANDNASGSATLLETVLTFNRMIETGQIPQPNRTLRFLWVPEFSGTIPWLADFDQHKKSEGRQIIAVLNLDMVGESPITVGTPLTITAPSISTPSFLPGMMKFVSEGVKENKVERNGWTYQLNYVLRPFAGGSDHLIFNDNYFGVPGVMFGHDDPYHHSSADSMDKVEVLECRSVGVIASVVAYALSSSNPSFLQEILPYVFSGIVEEATILEHKVNIAGDLSYAQQLRQRFLLSQLSINRLKSVLTIEDSDTLKNDVDHFIKLVENHFTHLNQKHLHLDDTGETEDQSNNTIIQRNFIGPLPFKRLMSPSRSSANQKRLGPLTEKYWGGIILELLNLANGIRNIEDIYLLLKIPYPEVTFEDLQFVVRLFIEEGIFSTVET